MTCPQCRLEMVESSEAVIPTKGVNASWILVEVACPHCVIGFAGPLVPMDLDKVEEFLAENS